MGVRLMVPALLCVIVTCGLVGCTYSSGPLIDLRGGDQDGGDGFAGGDGIFFGDVDAPPGAPSIDAPRVVFGINDEDVDLTVTTSDPDGDDVTVVWQQVSGPPATLDADGEDLTVTLPDALDAVVLLRVQACDDNGDCSTPRRVRVLSTDGFGNRGFVAPPPMGSDSNAGTLLAPWATIPHALDELETASPGDSHTVYVAEGIYGDRILMPQFSAVVGGYDSAFTQRDPRNIVTEVRVASASAIEFDAGSNGTEVRGLHVGVASTVPVIGATILVTNTVATLRDCFVEIPTGVEDVMGVQLISTGPGAPPVSVLLKDSEVFGGDSSNPNAEVIGVRAQGVGGFFSVRLETVTMVVGPSIIRPTMKGLDIRDGGDIDLLQSIITITDAPFGTPAPLHVARGIDHRGGGTVLLSGSTIIMGDDYSRSTAMQFGGPSAVEILGSFVAAGNSDGADNMSSTGLSLTQASAAEIQDSTVLSGSLSGGILLISQALRVNEGNVGAINSNFLAGSGTVSTGIEIEASSRVHLYGGRINIDEFGNLTCVGNERCLGVNVGFNNGLNLSTTPDPDSLSCCRESVHSVILSGTEIAGGSAFEATGLSVGNAGSSVCVDRSTLNAGFCTDRAVSTDRCVAAKVTDANVFIMHNSILYGGDGPVTRGAQLSAPAASATMVLANNYIHGGGLNAGGAGDQSTGIELLPNAGGMAGAGVDIRNNHIEAVGPLAAAVSEVGANADPGVFIHNNLLATGGTLYFNCNDTVCTGLISTGAIDGSLVGGNQNTSMAGAILSSTDCFSGRPDTGTVSFSGGSCVDAGWNVLLGMQGSCDDLCTAAWADRGGVPRGEPQLVGSCSLDSGVVGGDAANDIGPFEQ